MVISETLAGMLNAQISHELANRLQYLMIASWCHGQGLKGLESFFTTQASGEQEHADKFTAYLNEANAQVAVPAVEKRTSEFKDCEQIANLYVETEALTTEKIMALWRQTETDRDIGSQDLLQVMLREQIEEEGLAERFGNLVDLAGGDLLKLDLMFS